MARYVDINDVFRSLVESHCAMPNLAKMQEIFDSVPTADVKPVIRGEWIWQPKTETQSDGWECSACNIEYHTHVPYFGEFNYCPYCGADMRGEK